MISVIVPIYNGERYLKECIESILNQTYRDIELILVDDGSVDKSARICEEYRERDSRIQIIQQANEGVSSARNKGIKCAKGEFITFVDCDDWIEPNMYEVMIKEIEVLATDICICNNYYSTYHNIEVVQYGYLKDLAELSKEQGIKRLLEFHIPISLCSSVYRRSVVQGVLLSIDIHTLEDFEYQLYAICRANKIGIIQDVFYHYRYVESSASRKGINQKTLSALKLIPKVYQIIERECNQFLVEAIEIQPRILMSIVKVGIKNSKTSHQINMILKSVAKDSIRIVINSHNFKTQTKLAILLVSIHPNCFYKCYKILWNGKIRLCKLKRK